MTMLDSLDTLWVMGMGKELDEAALWLEQHVDFGKIGQVSFMETTIRALGGLLAAHEVRGGAVGRGPMQLCAFMAAWYTRRAFACRWLLLPWGENNSLARVPVLSLERGELVIGFQLQPLSAR
jgi:mannosyl-oligosaccharide alpha-1,2-mannosidase